MSLKGKKSRYRMIIDDASYRVDMPPEKIKELTKRLKKARPKDAIIYDTGQ